MLKTCTSNFSIPSPLPWMPLRRVYPFRFLFPALMCTTQATAIISNLPCSITIHRNPRKENLPSS